ncbi:MAG: glycogen debranching enzyme N-terminal domain-containing protein [Desulfamplus sp.]|nr:glycogen debranching enzyme N-terminal domain-containing protein [Desulfamplus sp.]
MVYHPLEAERGLDPNSDLFSPGYFTTSLSGGETVTMRASTPPCREGTILPEFTQPCGNRATVKEIISSVCNLNKLTPPGRVDDKPACDHPLVMKAIASSTNASIAQLEAFVCEHRIMKKTTAPLKTTTPLFDYFNNTGELPSGWIFTDAIKNSLDAFIVERGNNKSVIAGYPWFLDWGRDSLIFCRALIEAGRFADARDILDLFGSFEYNGTLPNMICGSDAGNRETSDAPLWFFAACRELVEKEGESFLDERINPHQDRTFRDVLISMAHSLVRGTHTGMGIDPETNLFYSPSHFTWMDTNFPAGSPRQGYPIEIQALWYYALVFLDRIDKSASAWKKMALDVQKNVIELFYREKEGFFSDCLHCDTRKSALTAIPDDALRPNQLFLITLGLLQFETARGEKMSIKTLESCMELLVPGAIRSLADRELAVPLHIYHTDPASGEGSALLKDPYHPYSGIYKGDEDTKRKPAYHNGTAWTWPFPVFCEAWAEVFGENRKEKMNSNEGIETARSWLGSSVALLRKGAAGYIPEILDGDAPHTPRGCDAQAWGSSELVRVWLKLEKM